MSDLRPPLRDLHGEPVDEVAIHRMWRGIAARRAPARRPLPRVALALAAALALCIAAIVWIRSRPAAGPLMLAGGGEIGKLEAKASEPAGAPIALSDGSSIALSPGAQLTALESTATSFSALLVAGRAELQVKPGGPRRWSIESGLTTVEVVGTRFVVDRSAARVRVEVREGVVLVRGERVPDRVRRLVAGDAIEIAEARADPAPTAAPSPPPPEASAAADASAARPPASAAAPPGWRDLARRGEHKKAWEALGREGVAEQARAASVDDLLALADVARLSGHPADALDPLQRVVDGHAGDPRAALAAFTLGRVALDSVGQPARAATAFSRAISLGLPAGLREDAGARLVEALARAGDRAGARRAADAYTQSYPNGRHAASVRRWSEPATPEAP